MNNKSIGFKDLFKISYSLFNVGIYMVAATFIGMLMGYYIDKLLKTKPIFFFIFLLLGLVEGFRNLFISGGKYLKDDSNKQNK